MIQSVRSILSLTHIARLLFAVRMLLILAIFLYLGIYLWAVASGSGLLRIASGSGQGYYDQFGKQIYQELQKSNSALTISFVKTEGGSESNIEAVKQGRADIAFIQSDEEIPEDIQVIAPLFREHLYIISSSVADNIRDLDQRKVFVYFGRNSGTDRLARKAFHLSGIQPLYEYSKGPRFNPKEELRSGSLAAIAAVIGQPGDLIFRDFNCKYRLNRDFAPLGIAVPAGFKEDGIGYEELDPEELSICGNRTFTTLYSQALLVAKRDIADRFAFELAQAADEILKQSDDNRRVEADFAQVDMVLHSGAKRFRKGEDKPKLLLAPDLRSLVPLIILIAAFVLLTRSLHRFIQIFALVVPEKIVMALYDTLPMKLFLMLELRRVLADLPEARKQDDEFVQLELQSAEVQSSTRFEPSVLSSTTLNERKHSSVVLIEGAGGAGKSTLLWYIFLDHFKRATLDDPIPLFLNAEDFKCKTSDPQSAVRKAIQVTMSNNIMRIDDDDIKALTNKRVTLLIDNIGISADVASEVIKSAQAAFTYGTIVGAGRRTMTMLPVANALLFRTVDLTPESASRLLSHLADVRKLSPAPLARVQQLIDARPDVVRQPLFVSLAVKLLSAADDERRAMQDGIRDGETAGNGAHAEYNRVPGNIGTLISQYLTSLLPERSTSMHPNNALDILAEIAIFLLFEERYSEQWFSPQEVIERCSPLLGGNDFYVFLEACRAAGVLRGRDGGQYRFFHTLIWAHLCARAIRGKSSVRSDWEQLVNDVIALRSDQQDVLVMLNYAEDDAASE